MCTSFKVYWRVELGDHYSINNNSLDLGETNFGRSCLRECAESRESIQEGIEIRFVNEFINEGSFTTDQLFYVIFRFEIQKPSAVLCVRSGKNLMRL